jgi:hypothetical protein
MKQNMNSSLNSEGKNGSLVIKNVNQSCLMTTSPTNSANSSFKHTCAVLEPKIYVRKVPRLNTRPIFSKSKIRGIQKIPGDLDHLEEYQ